MSKGFSAYFTFKQEDLKNNLSKVLDFAFEAKFTKIIFFYMGDQFIPKKLLQGKTKQEQLYMSDAFSKKFDVKDKDFILTLFDEFGLREIELWKGLAAAKSDREGKTIKKPKSKICIEQGHFTLTELSEQEFETIKKIFPEFKITPSYPGLFYFDSKWV